MSNSSGGSIDWVKDICWMYQHRLAIQANKVYVIGGVANLTSEKGKLLPSLGDDNVLKYFSNSYLRVLDFTRSTDISTTDITTVIYLDEEIPRFDSCQILIHDNVGYVFGDTDSSAVSRSLSADGKRYPESWKPVDPGRRIWPLDLRLVWNSRVRLWAEPVDSNLNWWPFTLDVDFPVTQLNTDLGEAWTIYADANGEWDDQRQAFISRYKMLRLQVSLEPDGRVTPRLEYIDESNELTSRNVIDRTGLLYIPGLGHSAAGIFVALMGSYEPSPHKEELDFLLQAHIYDIGTATWYSQDTTSNETTYPMHRVWTCFVVVSAQDQSSHNIYMYGGRMSSGDVYGDVWVLSLPSFQWIRVANAEVPHTLLAQHACVNLNDRYLLAYGGSTRGQMFSEPGTCNDHAYNQMRLFDLSSLEWTTRYEMDQTWRYLVPDKIQKVIGGNPTGGATVLEPLRGWVHPELAAIMQSTKVTSQAEDNKTPVAVIAGIVAGAVAFIILAVAAICYLRLRKRRLKNTNQPEILPEAFTGGKAELSGKDGCLSQQAVPEDGVARAEYSSEQPPNATGGHEQVYELSSSNGWVSELPSPRGG